MHFWETFGWLLWRTTRDGNVDDLMEMSETDSISFGYFLWIEHRISP